ncbi:MAG: glycoside hydrolase family 95 protein [Lachnospiraceae bacterium]|nr:glycoside hydrolase family 95 protein [Lachnospiraceae bacterium]
MKHSLQKCLWYRRPAESWVEGFPIGNGRLGGMVEGGVNRDHMYLNEESVWAGHPDDCVRTDALESMKEIQRLIFEGKSEQAGDMVMNHIMPPKRWFGSYQVLGELTIRFFKTIEYDTYERCLDLDTGVARAEMTEKRGGFGGPETAAVWQKEYFASAAHQVIAVSYSSASGERLNLEISLSREQEAEVLSPEEGVLLLKGRCGGDGISFAGMVLAVLHGGTMKTVRLRKGAAPALQILDAERVELFVSARTDYTCGDYLNQCASDVKRAKAAGYEEVKRCHIQEYQQYYERFDMGFEDGCGEELAPLTTYERLKRIRDGGRDENLYALFANYHRYLLLSASRPGCLPSNLQGLWNYQIFAPWESDYHANVNLQINYWPAEACQLGECHTTLFDWLEKVSRSGARTAKDYYGAGGWTLHHASNVFGHSAPCAVPAGLWPLGAAWLVRHLYEHYLYTGDEEFLENRAYPLMKGAAQFLADFLVEAPEGIDGAGYLVTNPSHSPENKFYGKDGTVTTFTYGAAMDFEIIRDLFGSCLEIIGHIRERKPGFEAAFEGRLREILTRIPPLKISERTGGIQEWIGDYEEWDPGHRHLSHLYALYPAHQITPEKTAELARAAKTTLERKLSHHYDGQGWSYGWMSCLWTRLREPERAYEALETIMKKLTLHNLFLEAHGCPQVGDAQAVPAAMLEMLVQFDGERIFILPSLPKAWGDGWVKGLKAPGGYVIDMSWKNGKVENITIQEDAVFHPYPIVMQE